MSDAANPPTNDPIALPAIIAEKRAENERLRQIIKELQRHRFGRRAESLPIDQLLLGLDEAEQIEAEGFAGEEAADPAKRAERARKRRNNRGSLLAHLPRVKQITDIQDKTCPCCRSAVSIRRRPRLAYSVMLRWISMRLSRLSTPYSVKAMVPSSCCVS